MTKELSTEITMTIKEVSDVLGKDESTIRKIGKELFPDIFRNGIRTNLNEKQVTAIKLNLGKNSELPKTEIEKELIIYQALQFQAEKISSLTKTIDSMKPKAEFYDQVTGSADTIDMSEAAKVLDMGIGRNSLFQFLRDKKILRENNQPYQQFVDRGYFRIIQSKYSTPNGDIHVNLKTVVYQSGLDYIRKLITESK